MVAAKDGIDEDAVGDRFFAAAAEIDPALGERLVAGDKDGAIVGFALAPLQFLHRRADDGAAVLVAAMGGEAEEQIGDLVEVGGEGRQPPDIAGALTQRGGTVVIEGDRDLRPLAVDAGCDELVDDLPELAFGLVDQAVHRVAGVEQQGELNLRLVRRYGLARAEHDEGQDHQKEEQQNTRVFHNPHPFN